MRRFQLSHNQSLDGVLDQLNSKNVTDAGPVQLVDDDDSADESELLGPAGSSLLRPAPAQEGTPTDRKGNWLQPPIWGMPKCQLDVCRTCCCLQVVPQPATGFQALLKLKQP